MLPGPRLGQHQHLLARVEPRRRRPVGGARAPRVLDHHHRVGAVRDRRAGRDLDAVARRERAGERLRRVGAADQPQHLRDAARGAGDVRRAHRVAVHRRAVERRLVHRRDDVLGQHAPVRQSSAIVSCRTSGTIASRIRRRASSIVMVSANGLTGFPSRCCWRRGRRPPARSTACATSRSRARARSRTAPAHPRRRRTQTVPPDAMRPVHRDEEDAAHRVGRPEAPALGQLGEDQAAEQHFFRERGGQRSGEIHQAARRQRRSRARSGARRACVPCRTPRQRGRPRSRRRTGARRGRTAGRGAMSEPVSRAGPTSRTPPPERPTARTSRRSSRSPGRPGSTARSMLKPTDARTAHTIIRSAIAGQKPGVPRGPVARELRKPVRAAVIVTASLPARGVRARAAAASRPRAARRAPSRAGTRGSRVRRGPRTPATASPPRRSHGS